MNFLLVIPLNAEDPLKTGKSEFLKLYERLKIKNDLSRKEKNNLAFIYKMNGEYSKSYELFKEIILMDKEDYNNLIALNMINYMAPLCDKADDLKQLYEKLINQVRNPFLSDIIKYSMIVNSIPDSLDKAKGLYRQLGFITNFFIIGPFKNENRTGMEIIYPPEVKIEFDKIYNKSAYHELKWTSIDISDLAGINGINLENYFTPDENSVSYLLFYIQIPEPGEHDIIYGSDDGIKIWINNQLIVDEDIIRPSYFEQNRVKVLFKKGINKVLVKVSQEKEEWNLYLRILPLDYIVINRATSEKQFEKQLALDTNYRPVYSFYKTEEKFQDNFAKGLYYYITGNYPDNDRLHEKYFGLCLKEDNDNPVYNYYYAVSLKDKNESKFYYLKSIKINPQDIESRYGIGELYYTVNNHDFSLNYFKQIEELNKSFYLARLYKGILLFKNGLYEQSLHEFDLCENNKIRLDDVYYYKAKIADLRKDYNKAAELYLKSFWVNSYNYNLTYYDNLMNYLTARNEHNKVQGLIKYSLNINPNNPSLLNNFAEYYLRKKDLLTCQQYINDSLKLDNYNPRALKIASDIMLALGATNRSVSFLEKILETDTHDNNIKRRIQFLKKKKEQSINDYAVHYSEIVKKIFKRSNEEYLNEYKEASGIIFYNADVIKVAPNGAKEKLITEICYILNDAGLKDFNDTSIDYNPGSERVEIKTAKTIYRDGVQFDASDISSHSLIDEGQKLYYQYERKVINFSKLKKDSVIVLQYHIWSQGEPELQKTYYSEKFICAGLYPVLNRTITVVLPEPLTLNYQYNNFKDNPDLKIEKTAGYKIYKWQFNDRKGIIYENPMPPMENLVSSLVVSTFYQWNQVGEWILKLSDEQMSINNEMKEFIKSLLAQYKEKEKIIEAVYNYVRDKIRYVGIEYGLGGIKPRNTINTWTSKYGDCKDKALLMSVLLNEAGIKAFMCLARTSDRGKEDFLIPCLDSFNHAICVIPLRNNYLFCDPTALYFQIDEFPFYDRVNKVFLLEKGNYQFIAPAEFNPDENKVVSVITNNLKNNLSMAGHIISYRFNQFRPLLRYESISKEDHVKKIESYWNSLLPGSRLQSLDYYLDENKFEYIINVNNFLREENEKYIFKPLVMNKLNLYQDFCSARERQYEVSMDYPYTVEILNSCIIDFDFKDVLLPKNKKIDNKFLSYNITYTREKNSLFINMKFRLKKDKIVPLDYLKFKASCKEIEQIENDEIEINK